MIREFFVLSRLERYQTKNKFLASLKERPVMTLALLLIGIGFYTLYLYLARWLVSFIYNQDVYGVLLASKLVQILLYISVGISLISALNTSMTHLYLSKDLEFHFSLPVDFNAWILHRFFQVYMQSNWMLLLFGGPLIFLFFYYSGSNVVVHLLAQLIFVTLSTFPIFIAAFLCMSLVKIFPARRVHQVFLVMTVVLISSLVLIFRWLEPEKWLGPGGLEEFRGFVDLVNLDSQTWNPAVWAYNAMMAMSQEIWPELWVPLIKLLVLFLLVVGLFLFASHKLYRSSWDRALQSLSGEGDMKAGEQKVSGLSRWLGHHQWSQESRELLLFMRDPAQWSQVFVMLALLVLCLFSLTKLPLSPFGQGRFQFSLAGTVMVDFICLSIASRFVFTSFSADGQAIWLMKTAPDGWNKFMRSKFLVFGVPCIVFSLLLTLFSGMILELNAAQLRIVTMHAFWDAVFLIFLSLGFGMLFINPGTENPLKMIVSPGGVLLMTTGLFVTGIHVLMRLNEYIPDLNILMMRIGWPDVRDGRVLYWYAGMTLVEAAFLFWLVRRGVNHLRKGDFS